MSARYTPKEIHPSIFEQVLSVTGGYMSGNVTDSKVTAAGNKHTQVWMAEYWKGILLWLVLIIPVIAMLPWLKEHVGKPAVLAAFFSGIIAWLSLGYWGLQKNRGLLTWEEIEAVRSALDLNENQTLYLDCLRYIEECSILDNEQKKTWRAALYQALDQAVTLEKLSSEMTHSAGGKDHAESLTEIERLEALADRSSDPVAQKAYTESANLARDRMAKWDGVAVQAERTEAHLELTRQTLLKTRDTLKSLSLEQQRTVYVDLEPLRANLGRIQSDAYEIQRAIEELREI
ncbi:MAG: hypothetical protein JST12_11065 [Armatimonadetes bacterium]|nr:hypothetical protein [Armatimonadota bacterium]